MPTRAARRKPTSPLEAITPNPQDRTKSISARRCTNVLCPPWSSEPGDQPDDRNEFRKTPIVLRDDGMGSASDTVNAGRGVLVGVTS